MLENIPWRTVLPHDSDGVHAHAFQVLSKPKAPGSGRYGAETLVFAAHRAPGWLELFVWVKRIEKSRISY
jgi:hypothetical protein